MARENDHGAEHFHACGCCRSMDRRDFMTTVGLSALAAQSGILGLGSAVAAGASPAGAKPRVRAVFFRPKEAHVWGWPGLAFDFNDLQAKYLKTMAEAAEKAGVELDVVAEPIADAAAVDKVVAECKQSPPDGIIATVLQLSRWPQASRFIAERGEIPTILFSPMGTCFTPHLQQPRKAKKCLTASTQDLGWPATGVKLLRTVWDMKTTRLCVINGTKTEDKRLDVIGTTLHWLPLDRWTGEWAKQETTDEVAALADEFIRTAKKIVEPNRRDVINAAKTYFVCKRIMAAENCQGISFNCLDLIRKLAIPCPPCMGYLKLRGEGVAAFCECDWNAGISMLLCGLLCGRPGFQQDPVPNTIAGTFMGAHCTSASRLRGFHEPPEPVILRSHSESNIGVSPQVIFPVGEPVTVMKFDGPGKMILGTGQVASNIDTPPCGGCRTSVELKMDNVADPRDCKGFHQLFILGRHERLLRAYGELAGIEVVPIA